MKTQSRWRGIYPPLLTPLTSEGGLDEASLERLIEHVLAGGVHGLFLLGTTGEGPSLSPRIQREVVQLACEIVADRVPILVALTNPCYSESLDLAGFAAGAGASAVVSSAPYYYPIGQAELGNYIERLASELPLPLFLYNMPSHTKVNFGVEVVKRAMELPNVIGIKDSSGDMTYFHRLVGLASNRPDWSVLVGPEELLAEAVLLGGQGGVCGGANLFPSLYVDLYEAAEAGDLERVRTLHNKVLEVSGALYSAAGESSGVIKGLKLALAHLEICKACMAPPLAEILPGAEERVREALDRLGIN